MKMAVISKLLFAVLQFVHLCNLYRSTFTVWNTLSRSDELNELKHITLHSCEKITFATDRSSPACKSCVSSVIPWQKRAVSSNLCTRNKDENSLLGKERSRSKTP